MTRITKFIFLSIFLSFLIGCSNKNIDMLPSVTIDSPFSFKTISIADTVKFDVLITNTGKEPVVIDYINIPCGCLADFHYDFYEMKPGQTDSITFIYRPSEIGYVEENVFAYFKGYKNPIHLLVKGRVTD